MGKDTRSNLIDDFDLHEDVFQGPFIATRFQVDDSIDGFKSISDFSEYGVLSIEVMRPFSILDDGTLYPI